MTATVADRVALWLADHPGSSADEIAHGVHARKQTVVDALSGPAFVRVMSGKRILYRLRGAARERTGTAPETDCEFLRRVLSDGEPHNLNEILRRSFADRGCGITVHSRASDLRKQGLDVVNWKDGERGAGSWYRLRPLDATGDDSLPSSKPVASSCRGTDGDQGAAAQLSLIEPAARGAYSEAAA